MAEEELPQYDEKVDIWSLGVVLIEAMTGRQPFLADCTKEMITQQQKQLAAMGPDGQTPLQRNC
jgi:serine/threonine protein kinase